jgi:hypothetical protein
MLQSPCGTRAVLAVGATKDLPPQGVMRYINRKPRLSFGAPQWLAADNLDPLYAQLLQATDTTPPVSDEEAKKLNYVVKDLDTPTS